MAGADKELTEWEALEVLELQPGASVEDIQRAHRGQIRLWHPDGQKPFRRVEAEARSRMINIARDILLDRAGRGAQRDFADQYEQVGPPESEAQPWDPWADVPNSSAQDTEPEYVYDPWDSASSGVAPEPGMPQSPDPEPDPYSSGGQRDWTHAQPWTGYPSSWDTGAWRTPYPQPADYQPQWYSHYSQPHPHPGGYPPQGGGQLAGWGKRLIARIIDGIIVAIPVGITSVFTSALVARAVTGPATADPVAGGIDTSVSTDLILLATFVTFATGFVIGLVYEGMMLAGSGATVGKKVMDLRVVPVTGPGRQPGLDSGTAWKRAAAWWGFYLIYAIPFAEYVGWIYPLLNGLWPLWDKPNQQSLNDKIAKTVVVTTR